MNLGTLFGFIPVLGVVAGLARAWFPRAPYIAAGIVIGLYLLALASTGIWAGQCWDCRGLSETRSDVFLVSAIWLGFVAAATLAGVWLGARLATMLGRLLHTVRELRDLRRPSVGSNPDAGRS